MVRPIGRSLQLTQQDQTRGTCTRRFQQMVSALLQSSSPSAPSELSFEAGAGAWTGHLPLLYKARSSSVSFVGRASIRSMNHIIKPLSFYATNTPPDTVMCTLLGEKCSGSLDRLIQRMTVAPVPAKAVLSGIHRSPTFLVICMAQP